MPSKSIIRAAYSAAEQSDHIMKVGAVLFKGGSVIRSACNNTKGLTAYLKYNKYGTRHAEMNVINNIPEDVLSDLSLLVVRVNRKGELTCAKPCQSCFKALLDVGLKKVYYTDYTGEVVRLQLRYVEDYRKELPPHWRLN